MACSKYLLIVNIAIIGFSFGSVVNLSSPSNPTDVALFNNKVYVSTFGGGIVELDENLKYIRTITSADGLGVNLIQSLWLADDKLWYGTIEGVGFIDKGGKPTYIYSPGNYRLIDVNDICECKDDVWFATEEGALRYNKLLDSWNLHFSEDGAILNDLYSVTSIDDRVYFGGVDRVFWYDYTENKWGHRNLTDKYSGIYINDIKELYGKLLIATTNGLYEYIPSEDRLNYPFFNIKSEAGSIYTDSKDIIVGLKGAIIKFNIESGRVEMAEILGDMDRGEVIKSISEIGNKIIVITENGAFRLDSNKAYKLDLGGTLPGPAVYDIESIGEDILVATLNGVVMCKNGKIDKMFYTKATVPPQSVGFIDGKIAVGTKFGLYTIEDGQFRYIKLPSVNDIIMSGEKIYIATDAGIYILNELESIERTIDITSGLPNNRISDLEIYKDKIYIATLGGGLAVVDPIDDRTLSLPESLKEIDTDYIFSLSSTNDLLFIGTWDRGLFIYNGTDVKNITWGDGLRHTDIWAMDLYYPYLFLSVRACGIDIYDIEKGVVVGYISSSDGLGSDYIRSIKVIGDNVYFGSAGGLAIMDISDIISLLKVAN